MFVELAVFSKSSIKINQLENSSNISSFFCAIIFLVETSKPKSKMQVFRSKNVIPLQKEC